jgi:cytidylate kinase
VAVITITGEKGTGSWKVVREVAQALDYDFIGDDLKRDIAEALNLSESEVEVFRKASQSRLLRKVDRYTCSLVQKVVDRERGCLDDDDFYKKTVELVEKLYTTGNLIIQNWGAQCILKDKPDTVHIRLTKDKQKKIEDAMAMFDLNFSAARKLVLDDERDMEQYLKQFFSADLNDSSLYDLSIDVGKTGSDSAVTMILDHVRQTPG